MKFGKLAPKNSYTTLRFAKYIAKLPPPPQSCDNWKRVMDTISDRSFSDLFPMDYNDQYGDCTIAGLAHATSLFRGMAGTGLIPSADSVKDLYFQLTDGSDSGLYCLDVLKYAHTHAVLDADPILAYAKINHKNLDDVKSAISLFGCVYLGFQVQEGCMEDFEAKRPWVPGTPTQEGHCVVAGAYDGNGVTVATWGAQQAGSWAWWNECVDEAYAILPADAKDPDFAPGFDMVQLSVDLLALT